MAGDKQRQQHTSDEEADEGQQGELLGQAGCVPILACNSWLSLLGRCLCCLKAAAWRPALICSRWLYLQEVAGRSCRRFKLYWQRTEKEAAEGLQGELPALLMAPGTVLVCTG